MFEKEMIKNYSNMFKSLVCNKTIEDIKTVDLKEMAGLNKLDQNENNLLADYS